MSLGFSMKPEDLIGFEMDVAAAFNAGRIRAPIHLHGGNEEQLIEIFKNVLDSDWVCTNWRSHYHCLLKGVPRERLMSDILEGKSITLCYPDYRIVSSAIVGGILPIAVGIALHIKCIGGSNKVHAFLGDMTARSGIYHECVQYACGWDLPIRFHIEDNGKSVCTPTATVWGQGLSTVKDRISSYSYNLPWPHSGAGKRVEF